MSTTALLWLGLVAGLAVASLARPVYGLSMYLLTFYLFPAFWWWGRPLPNLRWNLISGIVFLVAVLLHHFRTKTDPPGDPAVRRIGHIALAIMVNATLVQILFAPNLPVAMGAYIQLLKFILLFFLIVAAIRNPRDLRLVLWSIVLGAAYLGYEVTINDRGKVIKGRLENVGAAGVDNANQLASLMVTILPLAGGLFFWGRRVDKVLVGITGPLILNVVLQCNSRGAFLALLAGAASFLMMMNGAVLKRALLGLLLAGVVVYFVLGNVRVVDRFSTTFVSEEERDSSASGRLLLWKAGLSMLWDYPLGAGGDGFKRGAGGDYLPEAGVYRQGRSVHNGVINEACEWGIQGLTLRMLFIGLAVLLTRRTLRRQAAIGGGGEAALGCCLIASAAAFVVSAVFGDYMDDEWGYWVPALMVAYARLYGAAELPGVQTSPAPAAVAAGVDLDGRTPARSGHRQPPKVA